MLLQVQHLAIRPVFDCAALVLLFGASSKPPHSTETDSRCPLGTEGQQYKSHFVSRRSAQLRQYIHPMGPFSQCRFETRNIRDVWEDRRHSDSWQMRRVAVACNRAAEMADMHDVQPVLLLVDGV